jgi:hypothetical protein
VYELTFFYPYIKMRYYELCLKGLFWCIISSTIYFFTFHDVFSSSGIVVSSHDTIPRRPLSHYHSLYEDPDD